MGINLQDINESNVKKAVRLLSSANILRWIPQRLITKVVCLEAVKANGLAIKDVPERFLTRDLCIMAIMENHQAFWMIPSNLVNAELSEVAVKSLIDKARAARSLIFPYIGSAGCM